MTERCKEHEIEIAAAGAGELPERTRHHVETCRACARLRGDARALAGASGRAGEIPSRQARALARSALRDAGSRRTALWIAPLLSASASSAALILYFGIHDPSTSQADPNEKERTADASERRTQILPEAGQVSLPDSLKAVSEMLVQNTDKEMNP